MKGLVAGVDEAGRGPLAGPVFAAAVILDPLKPIDGLADSKLLSDKKRTALFDLIQERALAFGIGSADVAEIDAINILQATLLAMQRALANLKIKPDEALIDGIHCPVLPYKARGIVGGDRIVAEISAASIMAKVSRDRVMLALDAQFPDYGFAQHKGYGTALHLVQLKKLGPCAMHRRSFSPVRELLLG